MKRFALLLAIILAAPVVAREAVVTILHTNDIHGRVLSTAYDTDQGPGGLARISTMIREIRAKVPQAIVLDAGDAVQGTPTEFITQGETMINAMNVVGYDAVAYGNHEFDWTQAATATNAQRAKFPFLSANALDRLTGKPYGGAKEYVILTRDGVRIAVFGLTTTETPGIEWPNAISRVRFADPTPIAKRLVPELRKKADVVVCLSHLGYKVDLALAKAVPGIDIIIGGHSHTTLSKRVVVGKCIITQTGALGANLGRVDIRLQGVPGKWRIASVNGAAGRFWPAPWPQTALLPVPETVERDSDVVKGYEKAWAETQALLGEQLGIVAEEIPMPGASGHAALTLLLADLLKSAVRGDVAAMVPDYGPSLPAGPITNGDLFRTIGGFTRQNVVMVRATGKALRAAVEQANSGASKALVQFAGIGGRIVRLGRTARWEDATVNGRDLDETAAYSVAGGAYPIMEFPNLMASPLVSDRLGWLKPLLASAIRERKVLRPVAPTLEIVGEAQSGKQLPK